MNHLTGEQGTPVRFDIVIGTKKSPDMIVYKNHVEYQANTVNVTMQDPGDDQKIMDMAGNVAHITTPPAYSVTIDGHAWLNPIVHLWADAEAYLASQQYQIEEMELP